MVNYNNPYGGYSWQQSQSVPSNYFAWIQGGEPSVQAYQLPPNTTGIFMDSENPVIYMKSTDAMGRPSPIQKQYMVSEEQYKKLQNGTSNENFVSKEEFESAIAEIKQKYVIRKEFRNE